MKNNYNPLQLSFPYQDCMKEVVLDKIIEVVCKFYHVNPSDLTLKGKSCEMVAKAKKVISYLNPIYAQCDYKILMKKLGYGEKTKSRHTRNRKEVIKKMNTDESYHVEVTQIKKGVTDVITSQVVTDIERVLQKYAVDVSVTVVSKGNTITLNRGAKQ